MKLIVNTEIELNEPDADAGLVSWLQMRVIEFVGDGDGEQVIGHASAAIIHVGIAGDQLLDALDADSGELEALYSVYFEGNWFKEEFAEGFGCDLLYVSEVEIDPSFQGRNVELAVVRRLCDTLGSGCELAVIEAEDESSAAHWKQMGFEPSVAGAASGLMHMKVAHRHARIADPDGEGRFKILPNLSPRQRRTHH